MSENAWSPREDDANAWLSVKFEKPMRAMAVLIYESCHPGAIRSAHCLAPDGKQTASLSGQPSSGRKSRVLTWSDVQAGEVQGVELKVAAKTAAGPCQIDAVALVDEKGQLQWAATATASSVWQAKKPAGDPAAKPQTTRHGQADAEAQLKELLKHQEATIKRLQDELDRARKQSDSKPGAPLPQQPGNEPAKRDPAEGGSPAKPPQPQTGTSEPSDDRFELIRRWIGAGAESRAKPEKEAAPSQSASSTVHQPAELFRSKLIQAEQEARRARLHAKGEELRLKAAAKPGAIAQEVQKALMTDAFYQKARADLEQLLAHKRSEEQKGIRKPQIDDAIRQKEKLLESYVETVRRRVRDLILKDAVRDEVRIAQNEAAGKTRALQTFREADNKKAEITPVPVLPLGAAADKHEKETARVTIKAPLGQSATAAFSGVKQFERVTVDGEEVAFASIAKPNEVIVCGKRVGKAQIRAHDTDSKLYIVDVEFVEPQRPKPGGAKP
jgi:hypothetical protein